MSLPVSPAINAALVFWAEQPLTKSELVSPSLQGAADSSPPARTTSALPILKYTEEERRLADLARKIAASQNVLYHGTRHHQSILRTGVLFAPESCPVSLTRAPEVAAYFALLPRDDGEERGAILIFDRDRLQSRYRIRPLEESVVEIWNRHNEAEEELWTDTVTDVSSYLIGLVSEPARVHGDRVKVRNCKRTLEQEDRLADLLHFMPDWRCRPEQYVNSSLEKLEVARRALFDGSSILEAAEQAGLSIRAVRRLCGRLRERVPAATEAMDWHLNWNVAQVVSRWDLDGLLAKSKKLPSERISRTDLVGVFGMRRIQALMDYCGLSRDEALDELGQELRRLMRSPFDGTTSPAPAESMSA